MGQPQEALALLDRAVANQPGHVQAGLIRGIVKLQLGDREGAIESWETAAEGSPQSDPRLEHLLQLAREGKSTEEILTSRPPSGGP